MTVTRSAFIEERRDAWARLDQLARARHLTAAEWSELARCYRSVCADLARADSQGFGEDLRRHLEAVIARAHHRLYPEGLEPRWRIFDLLRYEFPRELRSSWRSFGVSSILFFGTLGFAAVVAHEFPAFAERVLSPEGLSQLEASYADGELARGSDGDAKMAGFYVYNNVGIAFRCFATGILGGLGSMFFLVYNGLLIGTSFGALLRSEAGWNLVEFASGHAAWELTAIVVAGAAGIRMGWALVETGGKTRMASLRGQAQAVFRLIAGAAVMLLVAAAIEGFWSAGPAPRTVKWVFGAAQWLMVAAWLFGSGRGVRR